MIHLWDGNNVMRRGLDKQQMPGHKIMSLRGRFEEMCSSTDTHIWVWDGKKHNERRRAIYPLYKMNRNPTPEDIFAQIRLFRDVLKHAPVYQIEVYGWEADDVIGTLVRKWPGCSVVHTNDMDYGQISDLCQLDGVNLKGVQPQWIALYKAMVGDSSDNIKGIPGFGPKRWDELEDHWPQIQRAIVLGDPAGFAGLPFKPAVAAWLADRENVSTLQNMLLVTHFQNVPEDELDGGTSLGTLNRFAGRGMLSEFFL